MSRSRSGPGRRAGMTGLRGAMEWGGYPMGRQLWLLKFLAFLAKNLPQVQLLQLLANFASNINIVDIADNADSGALKLHASYLKKAGRGRSLGPPPTFSASGRLHEVTFLVGFRGRWRR
jgi:hypothetical protein